jgi:CHASE1-domain containing sensor protein
MTHARDLHWTHWLVLAASLGLTIFAWDFSNRQIEGKFSTLFNHEADHVVELVQERLQKYEDGLWAGVAAIRANGGNISYSEWRTFAASLRLQDKYPGINGIGVIHHVPPDRLAAYLEDQRRERPEYRIHPPILKTNIGRLP